jgi:hypothetical protein
MLNFRSTTVGLLWGGVLFAATVPVSGQCEIHEGAKLTASDGVPGDNFGTSVSVDRDTAVVGAPSEFAGGPGSANVFRWNGSSWFEEQKLLASDGQAMDGFGYSVSVSGDLAVVGAVIDDDNGTDSGSAYVFRRNGLVWVQEQKLLASDGAAGDLFGAAVSVTGDLAVVGAWLDDDNGSASGSVYVFRHHPELLPAAPWVEEATLHPLDAAAGDYFGWSVCVLGDVVLVGARYGDGNETDSGSAYVFRWNGAAWVQEQELVASDGAENDEFALSLSLSASEDTIVVGAWHNNDAGLHSGSAYVFTRSGTTWTEQQKLTASDAAAIDYFGVSVSLSSNVAVVGAHFDDDNGSASGSAYVFRYHPELLIGNRWVEEHKLLASDGAVFDNFGVSVSVSGDMAVVGSRYDDDRGSDSGSAYFFKIGIVDCNANGIPDECDIAVTIGFSPQIEYETGNGNVEVVATAVLPSGQAVPLDLNGDGFPDLATANRYDNNVTVLLNKGDATFASQHYDPMGDFCFSITAADLDGDLDFDLAVANRGDQPGLTANQDHVSLLINNGDGTFVNGAPIELGDEARTQISIRAGDLDSDGDIDLVASLFTSDLVAVLLNGGSGSFSASFLSAGDNPVALSIVDVDSDLDADLAVGNYLEAGTVTILRNNGSGTFGSPTGYSVGIDPFHIAAADLDADGCP